MVLKKKKRYIYIYIYFFFFFFFSCERHFSKLRYVLVSTQISINPLPLAFRFVQLLTLTKANLVETDKADDIARVHLRLERM
jgi:hypothetical protein